jgi:hypothetical protein
MEIYTWPNHLSGYPPSAAMLTHCDHSVPLNRREPGANEAAGSLQSGPLACGHPRRVEPQAMPADREG